MPQPGPIVTPDGEEEFYIDHIIDKWKCGCRHQFLVHWLGYGAELDLWLPQSELIDTKALKLWEESKDLST